MKSQRGAEQLAHLRKDQCCRIKCDHLSESNQPQVWIEIQTVTPITKGRVMYYKTIAIM